MKNKWLNSGSLGVILGLFALSAASANAYMEDLSVRGSNYSEERHEAMEEAFANRDYSAWINLMQGRGRVAEVINEGNFARFAEAHDLVIQGKIDEAKKIRQELGLGLENGAGTRVGNRGCR